MAFIDIEFPKDIALQATVSLERATDVVTLASGREERNSRWANSRRRYNFSSGVKGRADIERITKMFETARGRFFCFRWHDGLDFQSCVLGHEISAQDQYIGIGDGIKTQFQLRKAYGENQDIYYRKISKPKTQSVRVAVNATELATTAFHVDGNNGMVSFATPLAPNALITAGYLFDVPVRFETDRLDIELSQFNAAVVSQLAVIEVLGE